MIFSEQLMIIIAGVSSGIISSLAATLPSLKDSPDMPWLLIILMILAIVMTGLVVLFLSVRSVTKNSLIASLKKE
jgi:ABC-type antimicrobial peptide transport system permease subunit